MPTFAQTFKLLLSINSIRHSIARSCPVMPQSHHIRSEFVTNRRKLPCTSPNCRRNVPCHHNLVRNRRKSSQIALFVPKSSQIRHSSLKIITIIRRNRRKCCYDLSLVSRCPKRLKCLEKGIENTRHVSKRYS